ncbi:hypothetical protein IED13_17910 [Bosea sp. SSUT16]|jgi:hypothetical protein|uniref:Uncharacterized protein n=1 Tax=Bosea spartocytisi TaxID=2773451 RepID=A0A927EEZ0_9HYPH|nr:hypothetical protein [Bosea spartocytisi]
MTTAATRQDYPRGCNGRCAEAALCGWKDGAPGKFSALLRPEIRVRQEPAEAERAANLMATSAIGTDDWDIVVNPARIGNIGARSRGKLGGSVTKSGVRC